MRMEGSTSCRPSRDCGMPRRRSHAEYLRVIAHSQDGPQGVGPSPGRIQESGWGRLVPIFCLIILKTRGRAVVFRSFLNRPWSTPLKAVLQLRDDPALWRTSPAGHSTARGSMCRSTSARSANLEQKKTPGRRTGQCDAVGCFPATWVTTLFKSSKCMGLVRKSSMPAARHPARSSAMTLAVRAQM